MVRLFYKITAGNTEILYTKVVKKGLVISAKTDLLGDSDGQPVHIGPSWIATIWQFLGRENRYEMPVKQYGMVTI